MTTAMKRVVSSKNGAEALLSAIWQKFGGPAALKKNYFPSFSTQSFINWKNRGKVPLKWASLVANTLKVPVWGFNYEELSIMFPTETPLWKDVVKSYNLGKYTEDVILYLKPPVRWYNG